MEWASLIQKLTMAGVISAVLCAIPSYSYSDTVYTAIDRNDEAMSGGPVEKFPESHFGMAPTRGFASRQVIEMETPDEVLSGSRSPASMEFASGGSSGTRRELIPPPARNLAPSVDPVAEQPHTDFASAVARNGVQEVAVIASDLGFFPKTIFVSRDVPVRMFVTGSSKNTLCIMMDSFQVRKQVRSQKIEEIAFTPGTPGKFRFYCPVNGMEGTLVVKELSTDRTYGQGRALTRVTASSDPVGN